MKIRPLRVNSSPKIMIIPMIDIIFFLLVFFMMSMLSMVVQKSMPVSLPAAESTKVDVVQKIPVTITKDQKLYVFQEPMSLDLFIKRLQVEKMKSDKISIILRADKDVPYGTFVNVMDTIKKIGISNVSIATDKK